MNSNELNSIPTNKITIASASLHVTLSLIDLNEALLSQPSAELPAPGWKKATGLWGSPTTTANAAYNQPLCFQYLVPGWDDPVASTWNYAMHGCPKHSREAEAASDCQWVKPSPPIDLGRAWAF